MTSLTIETIDGAAIVTALTIDGTRLEPDETKLHIEQIERDQDRLAREHGDPLNAAMNPTITRVTLSVRLGSTWYGPVTHDYYASNPVMLVVHDLPLGIPGLTDAP